MATDHTVKEVKLSSLASCQVDALVRGLHAMAPDSGMENVSLGYDCNLHQLNPLPTDIPSLKVNRLDIFETVLHLDVLMTLVKHLTVTTLELGSPYEYKKPLKLDPVTYNAEEKPIKVTSVTSMVSVRHDNLMQPFDVRCFFTNLLFIYIYICTTSAQCLRRWSNIVQMVCKYFVFSGA